MNVDKFIAVDTKAENGIDVVIQGAIKSVEKHEDLCLILVGDIQKNIHDRIITYETDVIVDANDKITNKDDRKKAKHSSTYITAKLVKDCVAQAGVSSGETKWVVYSLRNNNLRGIKGIKAPLAAKFPAYTPQGYSVLLDVGATVDCDHIDLLRFGVMASCFAKHEGIEDPRIVLLNNGVEEAKGKKRVKDANELFKAYAKVHFSFDYVGYLEADAIYSGEADIFVTDGFTGNNVLKASEGTAKFIKRRTKEAFNINLGTKISMGLFWLNNGYDFLVETTSPDKYGGAYFFCLQRPYVKAHSSANGMAIEAAIDLAYRGIEHDFYPEIVRDIELSKLVS